MLSGMILEPAPQASPLEFRPPPSQGRFQSAKLADMEVAVA